MWEYKISKYVLDFAFPAGTSRGILKHKTSFFIELYNKNYPLIKGIGEVSVIPGLSPDFQSDEEHLKSISFFCNEYFSKNNPFYDENELLQHIQSDNNLRQFPSILVALETAVLDLKNGGNRIIFINDFVKKVTKIPINGLIWMGEEDFMWQQIEDKINQSYRCIKLKIGGLDFEKECALLSKIRKKYGDSLVLRLDANGAFSFSNALDKLSELAHFNIHSIEQPIAKGHWDLMNTLCEKSPIPIALDEELIAVFKKEDKKALLEKIKPQFIVLKPSLHGGFIGCEEWIELAEKSQIAWWITSALESNIGLNAITQFTANYPIVLPHGLGTGKIYLNNIKSSLQVKNGFIVL
ncbi:MAG: o-succinylbenzoate synthase [Flavobacteriia bacterium]|nr:o-succinylbenzoate synthase [Flavobacteriia bacterium]